MPLAIADYKNWAAQNQQSAVALNGQKTGLEVAAKVGILAKFFGVGSASCSARCRWTRSSTTISTPASGASRTG